MKYLRSNNPRNPPAGKSEALRQAVNDQHIIFIHIIDVFCGTDGSAIALAGVIVSSVEFIHDQRSSITADVLNLGQFGVLDHLTCGVAGVGSQDD